jgi:hypothetical protein
MRLLVLAVLLSGCVRTGNGEVASDGRADGPSVDVPRVVDAPRADARRADARRADLVLPEAALPDVAPADAPVPDAAPPCVAKVDPATLLLYTFSGSGTQVTDATGKHHGALVGSGVARGLGAPGCGTAAVFPKSSSSYVVVPDATDWDLAQGSVDFSLRIDTPAVPYLRGIVSRDADNVDKPGHLSIYQLPDGGIAVRLQLTLNSGFVRCSPPVTFGAWHHVGVNWGPGGLELFVNGAAAQRTDSLKPGPITLQCGTSTEKGIEGNDNPWVLGTSSHQSAEGAATPTSFPFDGAIDSFRISKARRAFGKSP